MAINTDLQTVINELKKNQVEATNKIILNENRTTESINKQLAAVDAKGNRKVEGALRESLEFQKKEIADTQELRKLQQQSINIEKQNLDIGRQGQEKIKQLHQRQLYH